LTQRLNVDQTANVYINSVGTHVDPLTELRSRTNFGRPDFKRLFGAMKEGIREGQYMGELREGGADVGIYYCGPNAAAKSVMKAARSSTSKDVRFRFWKEHF